MSTQGLEVKISGLAEHQLSEENLERVYSSLIANMAILSVDMFVNADEAEIEFLFGVSSPEGLDPFSLVNGIIDDAIAKAFGESESVANFFTQRTDSRIAVFC